jgi:hypothetical protein
MSQKNTYMKTNFIPNSFEKEIIIQLHTTNTIRVKYSYSTISSSKKTLHIVFSLTIVIRINFQSIGQYNEIFVYKIL